MKILSTKIPGVILVQPDFHRDERGFFGRTFSEEKFSEANLNTDWPHCNLSRTIGQGLIRGLHWQQAPHEEIKLIRCSAGRICDIILDLRPGSPTFKEWQAFELDAQHPSLLYVPPGCAHGFQCLSDSCDVFYQMSTEYHGQSARGVRWNDPAFAIQWPILPGKVGARDSAWPDWVE